MVWEMERGDSFVISQYMPIRGECTQPFLHGSSGIGDQKEGIVV